jgi:hypothetical protein
MIAANILARFAIRKRSDVQKHFCLTKGVGIAQAEWRRSRRQQPSASQWRRPSREQPSASTVEEVAQHPAVQEEYRWKADSLLRNHYVIRF